MLYDRNINYFCVYRATPVSAASITSNKYSLFSYLFKNNCHEKVVVADVSVESEFISISRNQINEKSLLVKINKTYWFHR